MVDPVSPVAANGTSGTGTQGSTQAGDAFGLSFESLLKIVLTQLTYQDPLKPMDNYQFVSQLAQFSQIQQGQELVQHGQDTVQSLEALVSAQTAGQAAALLGRKATVVVDSGTIAGRVVSVSFASGSPTITIDPGGGTLRSNLSLANVVQIGE